jgi:hypothetical protein
MKSEVSTMSLDISLTFSIWIYPIILYNLFCCSAWMKLSQVHFTSFWSILRQINAVALAVLSSSIFRQISAVALAMSL